MAAQQSKHDLQTQANTSPSTILLAPDGFGACMEYFLIPSDPTSLLHSHHSSFLKAPCF